MKIIFFPLGSVTKANPPPVQNVWKERQAKTEALRAMMPANEDDEYAMIQWAIELSKLEAKQEEERKKYIYLLIYL